MRERGAGTSDINLKAATRELVGITEYNRWMRALVLVLVPVLTGCNLVFGVDGTPPDAPDAPGAMVEITGTITRALIHNDPQGLPIVEPGVLDPTKHCPTAFVDNTPLDVTCDAAAGTFAFTVPEATRYRLVTSNIHELVSAARSPGLRFPEWGRPDQQLLPDSQQVIMTLVDANNLGVTGGFGFSATGVYVPPTGANATAGTAEIKWTWPLLDGAKGDRLYAYREGLPDVSRTTYVVTADRGQTSVTMQPAMTTSPAIQLLPLPPDRCVHVSLDVMHHMDRLAQANAGIPPGRRGYLVYTAPVPAEGPGGLGNLARDVLDLSGGAAQTTFDVRDPYPAPLPGHGVLLYRVVDRYDATTAAYTGILTYDRLTAATCADPATCCEETTAFPDATLPTDLRVSEVPLSTANQVIGLGPSEAPVLTWKLGAGTPVDRISIALLRREAPLDPVSLTVVHRWSLTPDQDHVTIDPALLQPGTTYLVQIQADSGLPEASEGRFGFPLTYPLVSAVTRGQPFTVSK